MCVCVYRQVCKCVFVPMRASFPQPHSPAGRLNAPRAADGAVAAGGQQLVAVRVLPHLGVHKQGAAARAGGPVCVCVHLFIL